MYHVFMDQEELGTGYTSMQEAREQAAKFRHWFPDLAFVVKYIPS